MRLKDESKYGFRVQWTFLVAFKNDGDNLAWCSSFKARFNANHISQPVDLNDVSTIAIEWHTLQISRTTHIFFSSGVSFHEIYFVSPQIWWWGMHNNYVKTNFVFLCISVKTI